MKLGILIKKFGNLLSYKEEVFYEKNGQFIPSKQHPKIPDNTYFTQIKEVTQNRFYLTLLHGNLAFQRLLVVSSEWSHQDQTFIYKVVKRPRTIYGTEHYLICKYWREKDLMKYLLSDRWLQSNRSIIKGILNILSREQFYCDSKDYWHHIRDEKLYND